MNSPQNQERFSASMRPIVEEYGMLYIDNYPATYDAVFQNTPHAIKFAKNSAFHYLNAGRCGRSVCGRGGGARSARAPGGGVAPVAHRCRPSVWHPSRRRYLMAQLVLHALKQLAPASSLA